MWDRKRHRHRSSMTLCMCLGGQTVYLQYVVRAPCTGRAAAAKLAGRHEFKSQLYTNPTRDEVASDRKELTPRLGWQ